MFPFDDVIMLHNTAYNIAVSEVQHKSEFVPTKDTPYLTLSGELWGVTCEDLREN